MIQVSKTKKGKYIVADISDKNGKVIKASEPLNHKSSVTRNLVATCKIHGLPGFKFQDNTLDAPVVKWVSMAGLTSKTDDTPQKVYQPK